ncbi:MAG: glycosyltransferase family 39 protein [Polyangiales bacterium]
MSSPESLHVTPSGEAREPTLVADAEPASAAALSGDAAAVWPTSTWSPRVARWATALTFAFVAVLLFWRLAGFGVWDPWELRTADEARRLATETPSATGREHVGLGLWLVGLGFRVFGVHEWAGRLPIALAGLLCVWTAFQLTKRFSDTRGGVYAALVAATTPLLLFNARTMLGAAPDMALSGLLGLSALEALVPPSSERSAGKTWAWLAATLLLVWLTISTRGALLGVIPPLGAAVAGWWLDVERAREPRRWLRARGLVLSALLLASIAFVVRDVRRDATEYSAWLGGAAQTLAPTTFDAVLERVFHAFAPWSALLPIALSRFWLLDAGPDQQRPGIAAQRYVQSASLVWIGLAYGAQTLFISRYGRDVTFLALVPLALLVALGLRELEQEGVATWAAGIAVLLLCGLVLRDFVLFPNSPMHGMPVGNFEVPKVWNPRRSLSSALIPFAVCAALGLAVRDSTPKLDWRAPYRFIALQWRRGVSFKLWIAASALLLAGVCVVGVLAYAVPQRFHVPSLALKVLQRLVLAPLVLAAALAAGQLLIYVFARLASYRFVPLLLAGAGFGAYAAQHYLPRLSNHFSSRDVYTTYNELVKANEPLAEYRIGSRAAAYYAKGPVVETTNVSQLVDHLAGPGRRWAAFPGDDLGEIDHAYRQRTGKHLSVVDARSARAILAASEPVPGRSEQNHLSEAVLAQPPAELTQTVRVGFDERIELLGYTWELPHDTYVGAGESFTLTWYFRSQRKVTSPYRVFVHIDGQGQRIHGDHDVIEGKYPVPLWEPGDVIADRQKIDVPASSRAGEYVIYMGFYSGDTRLPIKQGPNAGEDRARVGVLRIQ